MAHPNKPVSIVIQDPNGQQQILQVMQTASTTGRPITSASVKTIVKEVTGQETSTIIPSQNFATPTVMQKLGPGQKIITVNNPKLMVNPNATRSSNGKHLVRFSPSKLGPFKIIAAPGQLSSSSSNNAGSTSTPITSKNLTAMLAPSTSVAASTSSSSIQVASTSSSSSGSYVVATASNSRHNAQQQQLLACTRSHTVPATTVPPSTVTATAPQTHGSSNAKGSHQNQHQQYNYGKTSKSSNSSGGSGASGAGGGQMHTPASRRRKTDKIGRGLRHFSMKVCEKVKEKGTTSYNEVADELVAEETSGGHPTANPSGDGSGASYDQKNIRRRVYDALNVLMAMNIISKEKKEIRWHGLPTSSVQECDDLERANEQARERIALKKQELRELILQHVAFKSLIARNQENEERGLVPNASSSIKLPFIIVNTDKRTHINCSISNDKSEFSFKFDNTFEIHDDVEVLKRMGLLLGLDKGKCTVEDISKIKAMVPKSLEKYIEVYGLGMENDTEEWSDQGYGGGTGLDYDDSSMQDASDLLPEASYGDYDGSEMNEDDMISEDGQDG